MSKINTFLQKRKEQDGNHGFGMILVAYVLSFAMLFVGSDSFYNISSSAANKAYSDEETKIQGVGDGLYINAIRQQPKELYNDLINPYGLKETEEELGEDILVTNEENEIISQNTNWILGYGMSLSEYDDVLKQLNQDLSKKKVEDNKKAKSNQYVVSASSDEIDMLERIVEAEAGGEGSKGKILVANVVINRVKDNHFPNSIEGVIHQQDSGEYQFSPLKDKRFWNVKVSKETKKAVKKALKGEDYSQGALYFIARKLASEKNTEWFDRSLQWLFQYGGHEFYKNK